MTSSKTKNLFICGHPKPDESRFQNLLMSRLAEQEVDCVKICDHHEYGMLDINAKQDMLIHADRIIFSFPFYWYSYPAVMKQWIEDLFTPGFAYARGGDKLNGKEFIVFTTLGAPEDAYRCTGFHHYTLEEFLRPIEQIVRYVGGIYLPPYVIYRSLFLSEAEIDDHVNKAAAYLLRRFPTKRQMYADMVDEAERLLVPIALEAIHQNKA